MGIIIFDAVSEDFFFWEKLFKDSKNNAENINKILLSTGKF